MLDDDDVGDGSIFRGQIGNSERPVKAENKRDQPSFHKMGVLREIRSALSRRFTDVALAQRRLW